MTGAWGATPLDRFRGAHYYRRMEAELARLETLLEQLLESHGQARAEVLELRARITALEAENRVLAEKVGVAVERLESLLENLPES